MSTANQALVIGGVLLIFAGVFSVLFLPRQWSARRAVTVAMTAVILGVGACLTGAVRSTNEDQAACAAKGGVLVRSTCIERSAVIDSGQ